MALWVALSTSLDWLWFTLTLTTWLSLVSPPLLLDFSVYLSGNLVGSSHFLRHAHRTLARLGIAAPMGSGSP